MGAMVEVYVAVRSGRLDGQEHFRDDRTTDETPLQRPFW